MIKQNKRARLSGIKTGKSPNASEAQPPAALATANDNRTRNSVLQQIALYRLMKKAGLARH